MASKAFDVVVDCGRDEDGLVIVFYTREYFTDVISETDVEHTIDLVENNPFHFIEVDQFFSVEVHNAAGRSDNYLCALFNFVKLFFH